MNVNTRFLLVSLLLVAAVLAACDSQTSPPMQSGKDYYQHYCAGCHKESGQGKFLKGVPSLAYNQLNVSQLSALIRGHRTKGVESRMPSFPELTPAEANAIAAYLHRELKK